MPVIQTTPTPTANTTAPATPRCTFTAKNPIIHNKLLNRWPHCLIKQSYNAKGENYSALTTPTPTARPTPTITAVSGNTSRDSDLRLIPGFAMLGIFLLAGLVVLIVHIIACCSDRRNRRNQEDQPTLFPRRLNARRRNPGQPSQTNSFQNFKSWFTSRFSRSTPQSREEARNLQNAIYLTPVERLSLCVRSFSKRGPTALSRPLENPHAPIEMVDLEHENGAVDANGLPPAYQTSEHLPLPTAPAPAYSWGGRDLLNEYRTQILAAGHPARVAARNPARLSASSHPAPLSIAVSPPTPAPARPEPPPPHYANHRSDPLYESESDDAAGDADDDSEVNFPSVLDRSGAEPDEPMHRREWDNVVEPAIYHWRGARREDLYSIDR